MKPRITALMATALAGSLTLAGCTMPGGERMATDEEMEAEGDMEMSMAEQPPFGGKADTDYAARLWQAMQGADLIGRDRTMSTPYEGQHPHGAILDTIDTELRLGGNTGALIIKRNYGGDGVSKQAVANDPDKWLGAVTVMYQRKGYDPDNQDWFWVKYKPDGSLHTNPKGMPLAGRVAKGMDAGCIACHRAAPGGDYVFNHDRL